MILNNMICFKMQVTGLSLDIGDYIMFVSVWWGFKRPSYWGVQGTNNAVEILAPTAANIRVRRMFKPNGIDVRKLRGARVEISMDPLELFDKKCIGLQRGRKKNFFKNLPPENFRLTFWNDGSGVCIRQSTRLAVRRPGFLVLAKPGAQGGTPHLSGF